MALRHAGLILGLPTVFCSADTAIFPHQGALYVSRSDGKESGLYAYQSSKQGTPAQLSPPRRIGAAIEHLLPSFPEGKLRLLSPGGMHDIDPQKGLGEKRPLPLPARCPASSLWSLADYNGDGRSDVIVFSLMAEDAKARIFYGRADGTHAESFVFQIDGKDFDASHVRSPHFVNMDDDDDLDFLHLNAVGRLIYYENRNTNSEPLYAAGRMLGSDVLQAIVPSDWDGDSLVDLIVVTQSGEIGWMKQVAVRNDRAPGFSGISFLFPDK